MAKLLSGSTLRKGGSNTYITLSTAQPQLPPTDTTSTGYTLVTTDRLVTSYRSSLGNLEMYQGEIYSNLPEGTIRLAGTGTGFVYVTKSTETTSTTTGALVVKGGVGIGGSIWTGKDIHVNGLTIGQGYAGTNNIVIQGVAKPQLNTYANGQQSIAIGYDTLQGLNSAYKTLAIGRYALSSGTELSNTIALGDGALKNVGVIHAMSYASIVNATQANPVVIEAPGHDLSTGTKVTILGVEGMTELNGNTYWVNWLSDTEVALYKNNILSVSLDGTGFNSYTSSGDLCRVYLRDNNIALGVDAGKLLLDGEKNIIIGNNAVNKLTTGSYNIYIGQDVNKNMITGKGNISIGGDQLVDGVDNQIGIGAVFYYNGDGYLQLNADSAAGLGTLATSTTFVGNITGATNESPVQLTIPGHELTSGEDIIIRDVNGMTELNGNIYWVKRVDGDNVLLHSGPELTTSTYVDGTMFGTYIDSGTVDEFQLTAAFEVLGGLGVSGNILSSGPLTITGTGTNIFNGNIVPGIAGVTLGTADHPFQSLHIAGETLYLGTLTFKSFDSTSFIVQSPAGEVTGTMGGLTLTSTATSLGIGSGALVVDGGLSVGKNANIFGPLHVDSGIDSDSISSGTIVVSGGVGISGNVNIGQALTVEGSSNITLSPSSASVSIEPTSGGTVNIKSSGLGRLDNIAIGQEPGGAAAGNFTILTATNIIVNGTQTAISTQSGALQVVGGVGIGADLVVGGTISGTFIGTINTATNMSGGDTGTIFFQTATDVTYRLPIGSSGTVLVVKDGVPFWGTSADIAGGGGGGSQGGGGNASTATDSVFINAVLPSTTYYLGLSELIGDYSPMDSDVTLTYDTTDNVLTTTKLAVVSTSTATSTTTGAVTVVGGVGIQGSIYSADGQVDENYLLYTPRITTSATPPNTPRIGDFWIDSNIAVEFQYIKDGTSTFWIQFTGL